MSDLIEGLIAGVGVGLLVDQTIKRDREKIEANIKYYADVMGITIEEARKQLDDQRQLATRY